MHSRYACGAKSRYEFSQPGIDLVEGLCNSAFAQPPRGISRAVIMQQHSLLCWRQVAEEEEEEEKRRAKKGEKMSSHSEMRKVVDSVAWISGKVDKGGRGRTRRRSDPESAEQIGRCSQWVNVAHSAHTESVAYFW